MCELTLQKAVARHKEEGMVARRTLSGIHIVIYLGLLDCEMYNSKNLIHSLVWELYICAGEARRRCAKSSVVNQALLGACS